MFIDRKKATPGSIGAEGEQLAVDYLVRQGYAIRERNYTVHPYEIDIIAQDGTEIVFVEVKTRNTYHFRSEYVVDYAKQRRIRSAASAYMGRYNPHLKMRFDVIYVIRTGDKTAIHHAIHAFRPKLKTY